jgi:Flp pilus assembly protein CpaB
MPRRRRALLFALAAVLCGVASVALALGYRQQVDASLGEMAEALVAGQPLRAGEPLRGRALRRLELREVPVRYLPPDALTDPEQAAGRSPAAPVPAGTYLLGSHLRSPGGRPRRPSLPAGRRPLALTVAGGEALRSAVGRGGGAAVDVVVAEEPRAGLRGRVAVAARRVPLLELVPSGEVTDSSSEPLWSATVAVRRAEALRLIEAENFARELRLIPR